MYLDLDTANDDAPPKVVAHQLKVLQGRATGATAALERLRWSDIGHALSSDIVIRDPAARGVRLRLRPRDDSGELQILEGAVELLGHTLAAPATAILPAYVPLKLGATAIAFGEAGDRRWEDADHLLRAGAGAEAPDAPGGDGGAPLPPWRLISPALKSLSRYEGLLPAAGGALAAMVIASLGWTSAREWLDRTPTPDAATAALARDGFPAVKVQPGDGGLVARGLLATAADLARLRDDIARRRWPISVEVIANDQLEAGVADILRANGYQAQVKAVGPGSFVASVRGGDPGALERVRQEAFRDNPGLRRLIVNGDDDSPGAVATEDPNKQVLSVVGGDLGYIQTVDGSRYFVGSVLPTGEKITYIDGRNVTLSLNGKVKTLEF